MIPVADILAWRTDHPWISNAQVEQDLIICRAVIELFSHALFREELAFRGGTALHKLFLTPATRYSEDIDLVQMKPGPIGPVIDAVRSCLDNWLGEPRRERSDGGVTLTYRIESEMPPVVPLKLKIEINTREHFTLMGLVEKPLIVTTRWFSGQADVLTFDLNELLATKLRALYQRRKGRDLFDLWLGLTQGKAQPDKVVAMFNKYMKAENHHILRSEFEQNLQNKMAYAGFLNDLPPLLRPGVDYDTQIAHQIIKQELIERLD